MEENMYPNQDLYSKSVRAGKQSKKVVRPNGDFSFEKHKIFLYKEDFEKFTEGLGDALRFIETNNGPAASKTQIPDFEDLVDEA
eukprot:gene15727-20098_t